MSQFKIGGKVVAISEGECTADDESFSVEIKKGEVYTVHSLKLCACGNLMLDLGFIRNQVSGKVMVLQCGNCEKEYNTPIVFIDSQYFVPVEEEEFKQVTFEKIVEQIPACAQ